MPDRMPPVENNVPVYLYIYIRNGPISGLCVRHARMSNRYLSTPYFFLAPVLLVPPPFAPGRDSKATSSWSSRANTSKPSCALPVSNSPTHLELVEAENTHKKAPRTKIVSALGAYHTWYGNI